MAYGEETPTINGAAGAARRAMTGSFAMLKAATGMAKPADSEMAEPMEMEAAIEPAPAAPPAPASVISINVEMKGSIVSGDAMRIYGAMEGDIRASALTICAGGSVKGDVTAEAVVVEGMIEGRIYGRDVRLCAGAMVKGEIIHSTLGIDTAAVFEGSVKRVADPLADSPSPAPKARA